MSVAATSWHVLGAGAIGGLWALRLARLGHAVTLLHHTPLSTERQLCVDESGSLVRHTFPERPTDQAGSISQLLVATKAPASVAALQDLLPQLRPGTPVLLLQNGMGVERWLQQTAPSLALLTGISTDGVWRRDRDHLVLAGRGETVIGVEGNAPLALAEAVAAQLHDARWPVQAVPDIRHRRWLKLAINCAINPLTALYRCRNGELLEKPEALAIMLRVCAEVAEVMSAEGMWADADSLFGTACAAAQKTAANISSMHADAAAGRATEIDFINGHVVACADQHGIAVPQNRELWQRVSQLHVCPS